MTHTDMNGVTMDYCVAAIISGFDAHMRDEGAVYDKRMTDTAITTAVYSVVVFLSRRPDSEIPEIIRKMHSTMPTKLT